MLGGSSRLTRPQQSILILGKHSLLELGSQDKDHRHLDHRPLWPQLDLPEGHLDLTNCSHSPIKVERLREYLASYDTVAANELLVGFSEGFLCITMALALKQIDINLKSVRDNEYESLRLVLEEVKKGRIG